MIEAEIATMLPETKEYLGPSEARKRQGKIFFLNFSEGHCPTTPLF
jgi:hypothetical protein